MICIRERKIFKKQFTISELLHAQKVHRRVPVRKISSIEGQIFSVSIVIGHISQIMTRYFSMDILSPWLWSSFISFSGGSIDQLKFWQDHLGKLNFKDIFESHKFSKIVYYDASPTGYAGYEINTVNGISHGVWSDEESAVFHLETTNGCLPLPQIICFFLASKRVKWFSDNQGLRLLFARVLWKRTTRDCFRDFFRSVFQSQFT